MLGRGREEPNDKNNQKKHRGQRDNRPAYTHYFLIFSAESKLTKGEGGGMSMVSV